MVAKLGGTFAEPSPASSGCPLPGDRIRFLCLREGLRDSLIEAAARGEGSFLLEHYGHQLNGVRFRLREILLRLLLDLFFLSEENHLKFFTDFPERVEDYLLSSSVAFERDVLENQRAYFGDIGKRHLKSRQTSDGRSRASQLRARMWKKLWKFRPPDLREFRMSQF